MLHVTKSKTVENTCFSCHKKKTKCDLAKKTPCSNCAKSESKCIPYNRKQKDYSDSSTDTKVKDKSKDGSKDKAKDKPKEKSKEKFKDKEKTKDQGDSKKAKKKDPPPGLSLSKDLDAIRKIDPLRELLGKERFLGRHVSFDEAMLTPSLSRENMSLPPADFQILREQGAFALPSNIIQHELISTFLEYGHVWAPVIDPAWLAGSSPSFLLLHCIFVAASRMSTYVQEWGPIEDFYRRAKLLFMFGFERDPLINIACAILLHFYNPIGSDTLATDTSAFWLHTAESIALKSGLHKEPPAKHNHRGLRRRLWWTIVLRDCITAAETGRPRTINLNDSDVLPPTIDDFPEQDFHARIFPVYLSICLRLGETVERSLRKELTPEYQRSSEDWLFRWVKQDVPGIAGQFPGYCFEARQVLVAYLANLIILDRSDTLDREVSPRSLLAASFMAGIFREFFQTNDVCRLGSSFGFYALTAGLVLTPATRVEALRGTVTEQLIIVKATIHTLSKQWVSASECQRTLDKLGKDVSRKRLKLRDTSRVTEEILPFFAGLDTSWCRLWGPVVDNEFDQTVSSLKLTTANRSLLEPYNNAQIRQWDEPPLPVSYPSLSFKSGGEAGSSWVVGHAA
ncbi:hypothetical protein BDW69DRAFT_189161 [Aspergillus filifer]